MPVRLDERVLMNVLRVLLIAEHVQRQPQHAAVITAHQRIERRPFAFLGRADQVIVFGALLQTSFHLLGSQLSTRSGLGGSSGHGCR